MELNLKINVDWIDDEMNISDTIKQNVIDSISNMINSKIEKDVQKHIEQNINETIINKIDSMTSDLFNEFLNRSITLTDSYGSKIKTYENIEQIIKEKFDNFMTQKVDSNGKPSSSSYDTKFSRVDYIITHQLEKFSNEFTTKAVKQVSEEIKLHVKEGLTTKLGAELMSVLKVNEMLKIENKNPF